MHFSLLQISVNYGCNKFYDTGPGREKFPSLAFGERANPFGQVEKGDVVMLATFPEANLYRSNS
jgi:hypothetical protein